MIDLYTGGALYPKRKHIFPLLKPFHKVESFSDVDRISLYRISEKDIQFVSDIQKAKYVILPMSWNYYQTENKMEEAFKIIKNAQRFSKTVLSFMIGDFGVKIPSFQNCLVFRHSGNKSNLSVNHIGLPAFIEDPIKTIFHSDSIKIKSYNTMPTIGFCGQANSSISNASKEIIATIIRNFKTKLGLSSLEPQPLLSTSYLRASILRIIENSNSVHSNFIYRNKYRAGATTNALRKKTTQEFYENMRDSDYVVCVRGAGNFSVRFYETLAMGRIPVFVNTDCLVPLKDVISWKKHVVWVEYNDRKHIAARVEAFHQNLTSEEFENLQHQNRKLWKEKLTLGGFFKSYFEHQSKD